MARVQYGTIITGIAGSIGGTTYALNRSGTTAKARVVGKRNINHNQAAALSLSNQFTALWNLIPNADKILFNNYALANSFTDRFGRVKLLTGFQWFKQLCQTNYYLNGIGITAPPAYAVPTALPTFTVTPDTGQIQITWSTPIDTTTETIYVYATPPIRGNARTQRSTYRLIDVRTLDVSTSFNIKTQWNTVFGLDFDALLLTGRFNINVMIFPISKSSLVTSLAQFNTGTTF